MGLVNFLRLSGSSKGGGSAGLKCPDSHGWSGLDQCDSVRRRRSSCPIAKPCCLPGRPAFITLMDPGGARWRW